MGRLLPVWGLTNNAKKFRVTFAVRQGARRSHSENYGDDEQRRIASKCAGMIRVICETPH
jgi:hypothetical protein